MADWTALRTEQFAVIVSNDYERLVEQSARFQFVENRCQHPVHIEQLIEVRVRAVARFARLKMLKSSRHLLERLVRCRGNVGHEEATGVRGALAEPGLDRAERFFFAQSPGNPWSSALAGHIIRVVKLINVALVEKIAKSS